MMLSLPLILAIISCLISVTLANNGCNDAMLNMRIINKDLPDLWNQYLDALDSAIPDFTVVQHCRAHSFTSPKWIESTVLALNISYLNKTYYAVLHYNSCDEITSMFADPIILIPITIVMHNSTGNLDYTTNPRADFCYNCTENATLKYCQACDSACMTEEINDLDFCYGPSGDECCRYIENEDCVASCEEGSSVDEMSTCILNHLCIRDNPCNTGNCTELSPTTYNCTCPDTYIGVNCSIQNPCYNNTNLCSGNGICNANESQPYFTCKCVMGVAGDRCQYNRLCNMSVSPCMNNGTCNVMDADNYTCSCASGYTGVNCETSPSTSAPLIEAIVGAVVVFVAIAIIILLIVIICVTYFYVKGKKGKVEISKKTSKVYPTNGNGTIAEKEPMLDTEKQ